MITQFVFDRYVIVFSRRHLAIPETLARYTGTQFLPVVGSIIRISVLILPLFYRQIKGWWY